MKLALSFSILCAAAAATFAGPESLPSGKEMKEVAPMAPVCPTWGGFYIGGFGGYKFSSVDPNLDLTGAWDGFTTGRDAIEAHAPNDLNNSGAELGGIIGYNYQRRNWVFGAEFDGGYLWARDLKFAGVFGVPGDSVDTYYLSSSFKTHYLLTFGPRIGYAFCRWLPYITGGLAVGDLDYSQRLVNVGIRTQGDSFSDNSSNSQTNVGWMVGGGLEYALTEHWRLRGQYQFIDLGDIDYDSAGTGVGGPAADFTAHHSASLREHNASFAVMYRF
jgi:outer membrane immunogenic protein